MTQLPDRMLLIGCGNMGGAMLDGWLAGGVTPATFTVVDPYVEHVPDGVRLFRELPNEEFDAVLLAIKPQGLSEAAEAIERVIGPRTVLLSILAGVELATLAQAFPRAGGLVRVMPNLSAALSKSPIALAGTGLGQAQTAMVDALADLLGQGEWFEENLFDLLTALAGSGPAFVYRFIDALGAGAAELGLPEAQARRLALATVEGATALAMQSDFSPGELARKVASPGGTTEAGLKVMDAQDRVLTLMRDTLEAAARRGAEMAQESRKTR